MITYLCIEYYNAGKEGTMDRKIEKKRFTIKTIIFALILFSLLLFGIYFFFFRDKSSRQYVKNWRFITATVKRGVFKEYIPVTGSFIPEKTVYLDAPDGGVIEKKYLDAGSFVKKGAKILTLVNSKLILEIMDREEEYFQLTNNLNNTQLIMEQSQLALHSRLLELDYQNKRVKRIFKGEEELIKQNFISSQQYENTKDEYDYVEKKRDLIIKTYTQEKLHRENQIKQNKEALKRKKKNLAIMNKRLDDMTIKAPISGHMTSLNAEIGESKYGGERLGQIDIYDKFKVRALINEHYIAKVNLKQKGTFTLDNKQYNLSVIKIYPEVKNSKFKVDMEFDGPQPESISRGQTLYIKFQIGQSDTTTLLKKGGFYKKTGGQWIYVLDKSEEFALKRRIMLNRQNPEFYEVVKGLKPDEKVIVSNYEQIYENIDKLILR